MSQMKFLKPESKTWERVWNIIAERNNGDRVCLNSRNGEEWHYMTTLVRNNRTVQHQFRHRDLNGERKYDVIDEELTDQTLYDFQ